MRLSTHQRQLQPITAHDLMRKTRKKYIYIKKEEASNKNKTHLFVDQTVHAANKLIIIHFECSEQTIVSMETRSDLKSLQTSQDSVVIFRFLWQPNILSFKQDINITRPHTFFWACHRIRQKYIPSVHAVFSHLGYFCHYEVSQQSRCQHKTVKCITCHPNQSATSEGELHDLYLFPVPIRFHVVAAHFVTSYSVILYQMIQNTSAPSCSFKCRNSIFTFLISKTNIVLNVSVQQESRNRLPYLQWNPALLLLPEGHLRSQKNPTQSPRLHRLTWRSDQRRHCGIRSWKHGVQNGLQIWGLQLHRLRMSLIWKLDFWR